MRNIFISYSRKMVFTSTGLVFRLCKTPILSPVLRAGICSLAMRDPNIKKPKPWPYERKKFTLLHWYFEGTLKRFDENTKLIVVEGNIGAGKTAFAKEIAEVFGMKYIPEPNLEATYITPYGYDLRVLDDLMPPSFKSIYVDKFYKNPYDRNVPTMQFRMLVLRFIDYINALKHILNTGDGVVMERCIYSDFVFMEAMLKAGYVRKALRDYYFEVYENCIECLMRPNLIIYLDIEPKTALQRIKERNREAEVNSSVLTEKYLSDIEDAYKNQYLTRLGTHSEVLVYDWNQFGDMEVVVEDIERIDFDNYSPYDKKMKDWRSDDDYEWGWRRRVYTNDIHRLLRYSEVIRFEVPEVFSTPEETHEYRDIMLKVPGIKYDYGFNPDLGDSYLFKLKEPPLHIGDLFRTERAVRDISN